MPICKKAITGNDISVNISQQTACGLIDANPVFSEVDRVSGKPERTNNYTKSAQVKKGRQARVNVKESETLETTIEFEVNENMVGYLENAFYNDFTTFFDYTATATIDIDNTANTITDSANGFTGLEAGQWVFVSDADSVEIDAKSFYIESKTNDGEIVVTAGQLAAIETGITGTFKATMLRTGDKTKYLTIQRRVKNLNAVADDTDFETQIDALVGSLSLTVPASGILTGSLALTAASIASEKLKITGQTDTAYVQKEVLSSCDAVDTSIWIDFSKTDAGFTTFSMELNNNVQTIQQAGLCTPGAIAAGTLTAGGDLGSIAFEENPLREVYKYNEGERFAITIPLKTPEGNSIYLTVRKALYTEATIPDGDEVIETSGTYDAEEDLYQTTVQLDMNFSHE
tara:strand:- start:220 stop:1422 length:1203 start_codon:yes stop_codon:yes gene_type:complete